MSLVERVSLAVAFPVAVAPTKQESGWPVADLAHLLVSAVVLGGLIWMGLDDLKGWDG